MLDYLHPLISYVLLSHALCQHILHLTHIMRLSLPNPGGLCTGDGLSEGGDGKGSAMQRSSHHQQQQQRRRPGPTHCLSRTGGEMEVSVFDCERCVSCHESRRGDSVAKRPEAHTCTLLCVSFSDLNLSLTSSLPFPLTHTGEHAQQQPGTCKCRQCEQQPEQQS